MSEKTIKVTEFALGVATFPQTVAALEQGQTFNNAGQTGLVTDSALDIPSNEIGFGY